jgi:hypothetical protein
MLFTVSTQQQLILLLPVHYNRFSQPLVMPQSDRFPIGSRFPSIALMAATVRSPSAGLRVARGPLRQLQAFYHGGLLRAGWSGDGAGRHSTQRQPKERRAHLSNRARRFSGGACQLPEAGLTVMM